MKYRFIYILLPCFVIALVAGIFFGSHLNKPERNRTYVRGERVEVPVSREESIANQIPRNSVAVWTDISKGSGINASVLTYDGCQYILVYSTSNGGMTMVKHEPPK